MDRWEVALHTTLIVLMFVAVWRVWVLGRQVRAAGDAARSARAGAADSYRGVGTAVSVYPVDVHVASAASAITVQKRRSGRPSDGGPATVTKAIPLLMLNSPASIKIASDVAQGYITHAVAGAVLFETLPGDAWDPSSDGGWKRPLSSKDVLVWAKPLSADAAKQFPLPALRDDAAIQLGEPERGYARALVMAF